MKKVCFAAFVLCALSSVALADEVGDPDLKIKMDTPAGYKMEKQGENKIILTDPKDEVQFFLIKAADQKAADAALGEFEQSLKTAIPDLHPTMKPATGKQNGMDAVHMKMEGTTTAKDATKIAVVIYKTPSGKFLIVAGAVKAKALGAHAAEVKKFIDSIRPI